MIVFQVNDMSCGRCTATLTRAIAGVDPAAAVEFDMAARRVRVQPQAASTAALQLAIEQAGYPASVVAQPGLPQTTPRAAGGCCGGSRKAAQVDASQPSAHAGASCCR